MKPVSMCKPIEAGEEIETGLKPPTKDANEQLSRVENDLYEMLEMDLEGDGKKKMQKFKK